MSTKCRHLTRSIGKATKGDSPSSSILGSCSPAPWLRDARVVALLQTILASGADLYRRISAWLWEHRRLRLNLRKGHIRSAKEVQSFLGYRVSRAGFDLGPKAVRRFRRSLPALLAGDPERLHRALASWRGAMGF